MSSMSGTGQAVIRDIWRGVTPVSDPILVVSVRAPGVRYVGRMMGGDFHVILRHAAMAAGAENSQLYRSLGRRLVEGWQVWKEAFYDRGESRGMDCLTFAGVKAFLGSLASPGTLPDCDPELVRRAWPAFEGDVPEGVCYPILARHYDLQARSVPSAPLRAVPLDRWLMPVLELGGGRWVPVNLFCRWFGLSVSATVRFLNDMRGDFGEKFRMVPGVGYRQLCVPLIRMPDMLCGLACEWRLQHNVAWERTLFLCRLLEGWVHCGGADEAGETASTAESRPDRTRGARPAAPCRVRPAPAPDIGSRPRTGGGRSEDL